MTLLQNCRPVRLTDRDLPELLDVRIMDGLVTDCAAVLAPAHAELVIDAAGRWLMPGLWDAHVHLGQWSRSRDRLDLAGTTGAENVTARVAQHLRAEKAEVVIGYGHRSAGWSRQPTVAELDRVSGTAAVVLISGDGHNGWLNSRAAASFGIDPPPGALSEDPWFATLARLEEVFPAPDPARTYQRAIEEARARGIVGVVDFEWERGPAAWRERATAGVGGIRVRASTYADGLDDVLAQGLREGAELGDPLVTMGPLKVIFDGSLNTATAYCCEPYPGPHETSTCGLLNLAPEQLRELVSRAHRGGLRAAVHAIGDAAVAHALDVFDTTGACGTIEHAQLVAADDLQRFRRREVAVSVQPAHLLDDRDVTQQLWADRQERCFPLRSLLDAGADLRLGSDAPVSPLDPWLAMAAAVHRSGDDRPPWNSAESITVLEALRASTDGHSHITPGMRADLILLEQDPLAPQASSAECAAYLRQITVASTLVAGEAAHLTF